MNCTRQRVCAFLWCVNDISSGPRGEERGRAGARESSRAVAASLEGGAVHSGQGRSVAGLVGHGDSSGF